MDNRSTQSAPPAPPAPPAPNAPLPVDPVLSSEPGSEELKKICTHVLSLLGDRVHRALPTSEQTWVNWHLSVCPACVRDAAEYFRIIRLAGTLSVLTPPADVERRLQALVTKAMKLSAPSDNSMDETLPT